MGEPLEVDVPPPARRSSGKRAPAKEKGFSEEFVRRMFISGFGIIGAMRPAAIRNQAPDLWDLSEEEARTMSEPAARLSRRLPAKYAAAIQNAWDPVLLVIALRSSLSDRFAAERRIVHEIRTGGTAQGRAGAGGAAAASARGYREHHPENSAGAGPEQPDWWNGVRTVDPDGA